MGAVGRGAFATDGPEAAQQHSHCCKECRETAALQAVPCGRPQHQQKLGEAEGSQRLACKCLRLKHDCRSRAPQHKVSAMRLSPPACTPERRQRPWSPLEACRSRSRSTDRRRDRSRSRERRHERSRDRCCLRWHLALQPVLSASLCCALFMQHALCC